MRRFIVFLIAFIMLSLLAANAQITPNYYWTALEKQPKWVHAVDVAYGKGGLNQAWHRYMIGSNEINKGLYWADPENQDWQPRTSPNEGVNKIISYRNEYENTAYGNIAFCSAYGVQIYRSVNGGNTWPFVPGSSDLHNKQFTTIEINPNAPSAQLYVGCEALTNEASVYKGISTDEGETWDWNPLDGGLTGVTIHDLEIDGNGTLICAATDDGIYRNYHYVWSQVLLSGSNVICVEALDREYSFWAATNEGGSNQQLYFMEVSPGDGPFSIQEIKIGPQQLSFGKIVNDISAIYVYGQGTDRQSVYVGTETGLYLFNADRNIPPNISDYIDFQDPNCPYSTPFRYDTRILTLDYYQETTASRERCILVGTENGVYLLTETSTHDLSEIESITCHEITSGTNNLIATSLALPDNSENPRLFINSNEGIIKYFDGSDWSFSGLSYPIAEPRYVGTDIATDFSGEDDYILASSKDDNGQGAIIHSEDGGTSWSDRTPENGLLINTLEFDPTNSNAYAAGSGENVLLSTDDGRSWTQVQGVSSTEFHDIYSNPSGQSAYLGGHGESGVDVRAYWYSGSQWGAIDDGLSSATDVNQFAQNADDYFAYAATDIGVFKADMSSYPPTWEARTYGIGTPELGSIVADKNNPYAFLASAALNNSTAKIWATGDSGRSWVELPLGDIPTVAHINKLAASQDDNSGFVAGTDLGVFYLGPIFKSGELTDDETWGPGTVIVNGDVTVPDGLTLRINPGTDVKFVYNFDKLASGSDQYKSELIVQGALVAEGDQNNTIVFESSHPDAPGANQWYGIRLESYSTVSFDYCLIEHAYYGITYSADAHLEVDHSHIVYCSAGGIYLANPPASHAIIDHSKISNCGYYGIRCVSGYFSAYGDTIQECVYGIRYDGSNSFSAIGCRITASPAIQSQYGIWVDRIFMTSPSPSIGDCYITGFAQGGIYLSNASGEISSTTIESCNAYGIKMSGSSTQLIGSSKNLIKSNTIGLYLTSSSSPTVRQTKFEQNTSRGVRVDEGSYPDFGTNTPNGAGNNSFIRANPTYIYYHIYNYNASNINAINNYWSPLGYMYHVNYIPYLASDPLRRLEATIVPLAEDLALATSYPNPFNPTVTISFNLASSQRVSAKIYNVMGQEIRELFNGTKARGTTNLVWDGKDMNGRPVSTGVYFCSIQTETKQQTIKLTMLK